MTTDWRDENAYRHFDELGLSGLAWECLRRNPQYRQDYRSMRRGLLPSTPWGLRFSG